MSSQPPTPSALRVVPGTVPSTPKAWTRRRQSIDAADLAKGVLAGDRTRLARAITLIESNAPTHAADAAALLQHILPHTGNSFRIGITGVPGVGKSTFIEHFGVHLCDAGHHVAVLAVDPSSSVTGGSILGDKTRMEKLCNHPNSFIRPSPSSGTLGGVARKSRETLLLCEAAGFDIVLVETVGVGQSEISVRGMVDFFLLLLLAGAGDELQGIKKGIIEMADAMVLTKADGDNVLRAETAAGELRRVVAHLQPGTVGWKIPVHLCSAIEKKGLADIHSTLESFQSFTKDSGVFDRRRKEQEGAWFRNLLREALMDWFQTQPGMVDRIQSTQEQVLAGRLPAALGVQQVLGALSAEKD